MKRCRNCLYQSPNRLPYCDDCQRMGATVARVWFVILLVEQVVRHYFL